MFSALLSTTNIEGRLFSGWSQLVACTFREPKVRFLLRRMKTLALE